MRSVRLKGEEPEYAKNDNVDKLRSPPKPKDNLEHEKYPRQKFELGLTVLVSSVVILIVMCFLGQTNFMFCFTLIVTLLWCGEKCFRKFTFDPDYAQQSPRDSDSVLQKILLTLHCLRPSWGSYYLWMLILLWYYSKNTTLFLCALRLIVPSIKLMVAFVVMNTLFDRFQQSGEPKGSARHKTLLVSKLVLDSRKSWIRSSAILLVMLAYNYNTVLRNELPEATQMRSKLNQGNCIVKTIMDSGLVNRTPQKMSADALPRAPKNKPTDSSVDTTQVADLSGQIPPDQCFMNTTETKNGYSEAIAKDVFEKLMKCMKTASTLRKNLGPKGTTTFCKVKCVLKHNVFKNKSYGYVQEKLKNKDLSGLVKFDFEIKSTEDDNNADDNKNTVSWVMCLVITLIPLAALPSMSVMSKKIAEADLNCTGNETLDNMNMLHPWWAESLMAFVMFLINLGMDITTIMINTVMQNLYEICTLARDTTLEWMSKNQGMVLGIICAVTLLYMCYKDKKFTVDMTDTILNSNVAIVCLVCLCVAQYFSSGNTPTTADIANAVAEATLKYQNAKNAV